MPRLGETRTIAMLFGLAAGFVAAVGITPVHALHITIDDDLGPSTAPPLVAIDEPIHLIGDADLEDDGVGFTHTFDFGVDLGGLASGDGFVSATPNFLPPEGVDDAGTTFIAGFASFEGTLEEPDGTIIPLVRLDTNPTTPRSNTISAEFAAIDTGDATPYTLTITGTLLDGVRLGNYSGNIGVTPLPGAALLFLSALGGLVAVRRYRQTAAAA